MFEQQRAKKEVESGYHDALARPAISLQCGSDDHWVREALESLSMMMEAYLERRTSLPSEELQRKCSPVVAVDSETVASEVFRDYAVPEALDADRSAPEGYIQWSHKHMANPIHRECKAL